MNAPERPTVAVYEPVGAPADEQELVHRPMTDEEYDVYLADVAAGAEREGPTARPAIVEQVAALEPDELAELRELLA